MMYLRITPKWRGAQTVKIDLTDAMGIYQRAKADGLSVTITDAGVIFDAGTENESKILGFFPE